MAYVIGSGRPIRRRARELASNTDLRVRPPTVHEATVPVKGDLVVRDKFDVPIDERLPMPGTVLSHKYKGRVVLVQVLRRGFEYNGDIARLGHVTRARVTQIMNMLLLVPDIQEEILFLPRTVSGRDPITERDIRAIGAEMDWTKQRRAWRRLCVK